MKSASMGMIGLAVGFLLGFALTRGNPPARSERSPGVERAHQLNRLIVRLSGLLDTEERRTAASERQPVPAGEGGRSERAAPQETPLYEFARRAMLEEKLQRLGGGPEDDEDEVSEKLRDRFVFKTYREVLSDLGRPSDLYATPNGVSFGYEFTDRDGNERTIRLLFADGFVCGASLENG